MCIYCFLHHCNILAIQPYDKGDKMVFSSLEFIFIFLPLFILIYGMVPARFKNTAVFGGSLIFYSIGVLETPIYILLFIITILFNFIIGQFIETFRKSRRFWLLLGIIFNFGWLIFFKYTSFIFENVNSVFSSLKLPLKEIILPIGISFYTFQNVSYIIDVYRKKTKAEKSFINYGAYITMFPQLIAGPIVTYNTVAEQLKKRHFNLKNIDSGLKTFTIGLGSKVLIANQIGGLWTDISSIGYESISTRLAWMGIFAFSFQIYFDFCGYSLMAIGLGKMIGFDLPKNFDHPYTAVTMTDFWRKWHITLGGWFREYIYIPLGGNRGQTMNTVRNILIVWLFTGFWHGASWNFVLWGFSLFVILISEKYATGKFFNKFRMLGHLYMLLIIPLTWLIFAITDFSQLGVYFTRLFPVFFNKTEIVFKEDYIKYWDIYKNFFIAGFVFSTKIPNNIYRKIKNTRLASIILLLIFWGAVYCMYKGMNDPFLYFRF